MIVACPSCETKFNVPDDKYAPGRKARCSSCGHVFALPELDAIPDIADLTAPQAPPVAPSAPVAAEPPAAEPAAAEGNYPFEEPDDVVLPPSGASSRPAKIKRLALAIAVVCLAVLLGYGGYKVFSSFRKPVAPVGPTAGEIAQQELVKNLALENVRQYIVNNNEKAGRMVVVEGRVVNNFKTPKEWIKLEVTLYDDKGKALASREQYCGVSLSLFQLQILSKKELEEALNNRVDVLANNTNVQPGQKVPFLTIFFAPPESTYEFGVKIVDVKDPAQKKQ